MSAVRGCIDGERGTPSYTFDRNKNLVHITSSELSPFYVNVNIGSHQVYGHMVDEMTPMVLETSYNDSTSIIRINSTDFPAFWIEIDKKHFTDISRSKPQPVNKKRKHFPP